MRIVHLLLVTLVLTLIASTALGAGCGSEETSGLDKGIGGYDQAAADLLMASAEKMGAQTSFRSESVTTVTGDEVMKALMPGTMVMEQERAGDSWNRRIITDSTEEATQEMYQVDGYYYLKKNGKWYYYDVDPINDAKRDAVDL